MDSPPDTNPILETLDRFDQCANAFAAHLKKIRSRVGRSKSAFRRRPSTKEIDKLLADLRGFTAAPAAPNFAVFLDDLDKRRNEMRRLLNDSFAEQLRKACRAGQIDFTSVSDGFGIGPFQLSLNPAKEQGALSYAKVVVAKDFAMDPATCVAEAKACKAFILDEASDEVKLRLDFEEAMRVALARRNKPTKGELRVELPSVFRELDLMRQAGSTSRAKTGSRYSLPRFVVEVSRLVKSESNLESKKPFRLETAVLENTKDSRRSVFIPKDLACGFGEGTYFQALTLVSE